VLHHFAIWQRQTHPAVLRGSKKSRMRMKVPSTTTLIFPTLSPLLTAGKNIVGYFLDSPRIHTGRVSGVQFHYQVEHKEFFSDISTVFAIN
jgi:hypothetical protein